MSDPADNVEITMDDAEIERLLAVCEAATKGPWVQRAVRHDDWGCVRSSASPDRFVVAVARCGSLDSFNEDALNRHRAAGTDPTEHNALFITEARTALPAALKALREARALLAEARAHLDYRDGDHVERCNRIDAFLGSDR